MKRALVLVLAIGTLASADEGDAARAPLRAYFEAKDDDARRRALEALDAVPVPPLPAVRAKLLREAMATRTRGPSRRDDTLELAEGKTECFSTGPREAGKKSTPVVLSLHGAHGTGHEGLQPFALPDEEWKDLRKKIDAELRAKGHDPAKVTVKRPAPLLPWEDGLVVAPTWIEPTAQHVSLDRSAEVCLAAIARANRHLGGDADRVVLTGLSLGGAVAVQVAARHPDRFAGVVTIGGSAPEAPLENLAPLEVFVLHGAKDDVVPVDEGRALDRRLGEAKIRHVFREVPELGHKWPPASEGGRLKAWMRERTRDPWPRRVVHRFHASPRPRRVFWVEVPGGPEATVDARLEGNDVSLDVRGTTTVVLHLSAPLVDFEAPIVVKRGDRELHRGKANPSWRELLADLERDGFDVSRAGAVRLEVKLDGEPRPPG